MSSFTRLPRTIQRARLSYRTIPLLLLAASPNLTAAQTTPNAANASAATNGTAANSPNFFNGANGMILNGNVRSRVPFVMNRAAFFNGNNGAANRMQQNANGLNPYGGATFIAPDFGGTFGQRPSVLSPFSTYNPYPAQSPQQSGVGENEIHSYTSVLSPFATYRQPAATQNANRFHQTYRYSNGLEGRGGVTLSWGGAYFPDGLAYYPNYAPQYVNGATAASPYAYYSTLPTYIVVTDVVAAPPQVVYVPVPVYTNGGVYNGERREDIDEYYLNRKAKDDAEKPAKPKATDTASDAPAASPKERPIDRAAADIARAWKEQDAQLLSKYVGAKSKVAVTLRGKYQYSLEATDYLDMTRDAFKAMKTVRFTLDAPQRKERGVYTISGRHVYRGKDGDERTIHVSYVVEQQTDDSYLITQVGSAPDRIEE